MFFALFCHTVLGFVPGEGGNLELFVLSQAPRMIHVCVVEAKLI